MTGSIPSYLKQVPSYLANNRAFIDNAEKTGKVFKDLNGRYFYKRDNPATTVGAVKTDPQKQISMSQGQEAPVSRDITQKSNAERPLPPLQ